MILVDGPNFIWRAAFAGGALESKGRPSAALHVGLSMLAAMHGLFTPQRLVFLWDGRQSWRRKLYPEYKANRKDDALVNREAVFAQITVFQSILTCAGMMQVYVDDLEADDLAGLLVKSFTVRPIVLLSSDKDWFQLLEVDVTQVRGWSGSKLDVWTADRVLKEKGIPVSQWAQFLALVGDKVDNIPNAGRGIGEVKARRIVQGLDILPEPYTKQYEFNLKLTTIHTQVHQCGLKRSDFKCSAQTTEAWDRLEKLLLDYELYSVWKERRKIRDMGGWR